MKNRFHLQLFVCMSLLFAFCQDHAWACATCTGADTTVTIINATLGASATITDGGESIEFNASGDLVGSVTLSEGETSGSAACTVDSSISPITVSPGTPLTVNVSVTPSGGDASNIESWISFDVKCAGVAISGTGTTQVGPCHPGADGTPVQTVTINSDDTGTINASVQISTNSPNDPVGDWVNPAPQVTNNDPWNCAVNFAMTMSTSPDNNGNQQPDGYLVWSVPSGDLSEATSTNSVSMAYTSGTVSGNTYTDAAGQWQTTVQTTSADGGSTLTISCIATGSATPLTQFVVSQSSSNQATIKEFRDGQQINQYVLNQLSPESVSVSNTATGIVDTQTFDGTTLTVTDTKTYVSGATSDLVSSSSDTYETVPWGYALAQSTDAQGRATTYAYVTDSNSAGYQQVQDETLPDGNWVYYQYDGFPDGYNSLLPTSAKPEWLRYTPWRNSSIPGSNPSDSSGMVMTMAYQLPPGSGSYLYGLVTLTNEQTTARSEAATSSSNSIDGMSLDLTVDTTWYGPDASISTLTYSYPNNYADDTFLDGLTYATIDATGHRMTYYYTQGTYDIAADTFYAESGGTALLTEQVEGTSSSPLGISGESTVINQVTDIRGNAVRLDDYVCIDPGDIEPMLSVLSTYDDMGNLIEQQRQLPSGSPVTTFTGSYSVNVLVSSTNEFGVVTWPIYQGRTQGKIVFDGTTTRTLSTTVDTAGRLVSRTGSNGLETSFAYSTVSGSGPTVTVTHPSGGTSVFQHYCDGQIAGVNGSAEIATGYDYSAAYGSLSRTATQSGDGGTRITTTTTDMMGRVTAVTTPTFPTAGGGTITTNYGYDPSTGLLTSVTLGDGSLLPPFYLTYDSLGRLSTFGATNRANEIDNSYAMDPSLNWCSMVVKKVPAASGTNRVTALQVMSRVDGLETIVTGPDGSTTIATATVNRAAQTVSVAKTTSVVSTTPATSIYAGGSSLLSSADSLGHTTTYGYDSNGRLAKITDPLGNMTQIAYVPASQPGAGQVQTLTFPNSTTQSFGYNLLGLQISNTGTAVYPVTYGYNDFGEMTSMTTQQTSSVSSTTTWVRDLGTGLVSSKQDAAGKSITYTYDNAQRLATRTWARGVVTTYSYAGGDLATITYTEGTPSVTCTNYQNNGLPGQITDAAGTRTLTYSDFGDIADETLGSGSGLLAGISVDRVYIGAVRQSLGATDNGASIITTSTYNYGAATHLLNGITQGTISVAYGYLGNSSLLATATSTNGTSLLRTTNYDADERPTSVVNSVSGTVLSANGIISNPMEYDSGSHRTAIPRQDGSQWSYGYDSRGELTGGTNQFMGGEAMPGYQFGYQFDEIGDRTQTTVNGRTANYSVNALNQYSQRDVPGAVDITGTASPLATVTVNNSPTQRQGGYFYGSVTAANSSAPVLVSATTVGVVQGSGTGEDTVSTLAGTTVLPQTPESFQYDDDGNLIQDGKWTYTWDAENRLIQMVSLDTIPSPARLKLTFAYDWQGRRIDKSVYHWNSGSSSFTLVSDTRFVYDGCDLIAELDATNGNSLLRSYLWGQDLSGRLQGAGGIGGLIAVTSGSSNTGTYLVHYDANGNVLGLVDNSGIVVGTYEYGPFGEVIRASGAMAGINPFQWSTKYIDQETGLSYYGFRYYQPETGRWISRDPLGDLAFSKLRTRGKRMSYKLWMKSLTPLYEFVRNSPTFLLDKLGLDVTWSPARCSQGQTKFIQTVYDAPYFTIAGINIGTQAPFVDDGTHGSGTPPGQLDPPYYPNTYPGTFDDNPTPNNRTYFILCRVCVCNNKIIKRGPCKKYSANFDGDLSTLPDQ